MFSGFSQGAKNLFKFPTVKRSALSLKAEKAAAGTGSNGGAGIGQTFKVVAGMKEVRVHSAEVGQRLLLSPLEVVKGLMLTRSFAFPGSSSRSLPRSIEPTRLLDSREPCLFPFSLDLLDQGSPHPSTPRLWPR
jgi:hypothetical protein